MVEVVPPVAVLGQKRLAVEVGSGCLEAGVEVGVNGPRLWLGSVNDGEEDRKEYWVEHGVELVVGQNGKSQSCEI